jgi:hypothetical protein
MSTNELLTDPESIRCNQNGQLTKDQHSALKSKLGGLPGWLIVGLMFALLVLVALLGGKTLSRSTPLALIALVGVIVITFAIVSFLGNILGGLRMVGVRIEQVPGQIVWSKNRYTAVSGGRTLEPINNSLNLQPGDYRFYRMRGTNYLLSAQRVDAAVSGGQASPAAAMDIQSFEALLDKPLDFDPRLEPARAAEHLAQLEQAAKNMKASPPSGFTKPEAEEMMRKAVSQMKLLTKGQKLRDVVQMVQQAENVSQPKLDREGLIQLNNALEQTGVRHPATLNANAAGRQAAGQRVALTKDIASNLLWAAVFGAGWLVFSYLFITRHEWKGLLAITAFAGIVMIAFIVNARRELSDFLSGSVQEEEGWVTKFSRTNNSGRSSYTHYFYKVNQNNLEVSQYAYQALIEGNYRVYYLPNTRRLVNIDPMTDASS